MKFTWRPDAFLELVRAAIPVMVLFGFINWTTEMQAGATLVVSLLVSFVTVSFMTVDTKTLENAGTSKTQVMEAAAANVAAGTPGGTGTPGTPGGAGGENAPKGLGNFSDKGTRSLLLALFLIPSLVLGGCARGANPNMSPERKVALYGIQVATHLKEAKAVADTLFATNTLAKPAYERVLETLLKVNKAGDDLGNALLVYDAATDDVARADAVKQVDAALATLNVLLPTVLSEVAGTEGRAKVARIITDVQRLILTITRMTSGTSAKLDLGFEREFDVEAPRDHWLYNTPVEAN